MRTRVLLVLLTLLLAGCGSDGGSPPAEPSAGAVTIATRFGDVTVPAAPTRVVAMSWTDADLALAVGITPVAMAKETTIPGGIQPWAKERLGGAVPELFTAVGADPIEQIASFRPDVILATKDYNLAKGETYAQLSRIAPVIAYEDDPQTASYAEEAIRVGRALGREQQARDSVTAVERLLDDQEAAAPQLAGTTFAFGLAPKNGSLFVVNGQDAVLTQLLGQVGMRLAPAVAALPAGSVGSRAELSFERLSVLDADVLLLTPASASDADLAALEADPLFTRLAVVQRGDYLRLDRSAAQAVNFSSPLSLQYTLSRLLPRIAAAAG